VTFYVAEHFQPTEIVGMDIDQQLIQQAQNQLRNRIQTANTNNNNNNQTNKRYPYNLRFQQV
jgi:ribosomal protein L11 methylase PrmA